MEPRVLELLIAALSKDPLWFAIYSSSILILFSLIVGCQTIIRLTLFICVLPSLRSLRTGQDDAFWTRYWMVVGLASNLGLPSVVRAALFIWCAVPHNANGTDMIFNLAEKTFI